jgi:hypothetical protein
MGLVRPTGDRAAELRLYGTLIWIANLIGIHGDDSDEYERFGGTRLSERRPPRPKGSTGA